jgi:phosphatidylethanolamine/phosphatidyl-N-methylethanolamine N-methyltransferase
MALLFAIRGGDNDAILVERRKVAPFGIYTLVCFERVVPSAE